EAARAGEAGAGFAVVADEVRNLAMRAADAAKNTADLIEGTVKKVQDSKELLSDTNEAFSEVENNSSKVKQLVSEIFTSSNEQAKGIEQVNLAVSEMDKVTQGTAANAEESASASEELNAQAYHMKEIVNELKIIVDGAGQVVETRQARPGITARTPAMQKKVESISYKPENIIPLDDEDDFRDFEPGGAPA
ncbi:methyl-accepting chemotaxis protein, partial [Thermodesulfobacteriota bacterium]